MKKFHLVAAVLILMVSLPGVRAQDDGGRMRFRITLDAGYRGAPVSGRIYVMMTSSRQVLEFIEPSITDLRSVWICSQEVKDLAAGKSVDIDPDVNAFPKPFSQAAEANYQVMALMDIDHSYPYSGAGAGDLYGNVTRLTATWPVRAGLVQLRLVSQAPDESFAETPTHKLPKIRSALLSSFWGRDIMMRAAVILPPSYEKSPDRRYPTVYYIHGFGASHADALSNREACCAPIVPEMEKNMASGKWPEMVYVFLNATCPFGHHSFVDSVNNGPWGTALVEEFIPYLEKQFRLEAKPVSRFLTGHSSGGWSALWLQVTHPDFFGGAWGTSPDPVDFRNWTGPDLWKSPPDNFYWKNTGGPRWLIRQGVHDVVTVGDYARWENVLGDQGGQLASFEAVFSPRGEDGRPMRLFNRDTGAIDPFVEQAWRKYDISELLKKNWEELGLKLKGKLHVTVGSLDSIHLEESVYLLRDRLKELKSDAEINILDGRDHFDIYKDDFAQKMAWEMYKKAHPEDAASKK